MPDAEVTGEGRQRTLVEDLGHQSEVLDHGDGLPVGDRHPRRLLTAVLQGEQPEVDEVGGSLIGGVYAEDPASLAGSVVLFGVSCVH